VALFAAWACGMVAVLVAVVGLRDIGPPTEWQSYASSAAGFDVEFPTAPIEKTNGAGAGSVMATRGFSRAYAVGWFALPDDGSTVRDWLIRRRDDLLKGAGGGESVLEHEEPPGEHDLRFAIRLPNGTVHDTRVVVANGRMFTLIAAAPSVEADGRRFLDSFHAWSEPNR